MCTATVPATRIPRTNIDGQGFTGPLRGFAHAHIGWLFKVNATSAERFAPDLVRDSDVAVISRLFPLFAVLLARGSVLSRLGVVGNHRRRAHRAALGGSGAHDAACTT